MNKTSCYSYFYIESAGEIKEIGTDECGRTIADFVADERSNFDPDEITEILGIIPDHTVRMGERIKNSARVSRFSSWKACAQDSEPCFDVEEQLLNIVEKLSPLIPKILEIKKKYNVVSGINIVPHIYGEQSPALDFGAKVIEFCYLTGSKIGVDIYVYNDGDENE